METNPYQVKMDPQAHKQLKKLANQLGITIGEMIQNLLASFKFRLKRIAEKHGAMIDSELHTEIIRLLLKMDAGKLTEEEVNENIKELYNRNKEESWMPEVILGPETWPVRYLSVRERSREKRERDDVKKVRKASQKAASKAETNK